MLNAWDWTVTIYKRITQVLPTVNWDADQGILIPRMTLKAGRSTDKKSRCDMTCKQREPDGFRTDQPD